MAEPQPQFWFSQISSNTPNLHSLAVVKAVNQVVKLFTSESKQSHLISICNKCKDQGILSSSSLDAKLVLKDIRKFLELKAEPPFYVLGTVTKNEAIAQSWNGLGLNLFDLPWGKLPKIFRYIPILSLPDMLKTVICNIYEDNGAYHKQHAQAINDIEWAKCHGWIRSIQSDFGHGNRDKMQFYEMPDGISETNQTNIVLTKYPNIYLQGSLWALWQAFGENQRSEYYYSKMISAISNVNKSETRARHGNAPVIKKERRKP